MQTPPEVTTAPSTPRRQRRYLAFGVVLVALIVAASVLLDRAGASRHENRGRSNERQLETAGAPAFSR
jgi:hypothetical protein